MSNSQYVEIACIRPYRGELCRARLDSRRSWMDSSKASIDIRRARRVVCPEPRDNNNVRCPA